MTRDPDPGAREHPERWLLRGVRRLLSGASVGERVSPSKDEWLEMKSALEFMVPAVLKRRYRVWNYESLDGFTLAEARVADPRTVDLLGLAQLITSQAWVPAEVRLELARDMNSFVRLECRLGDGPGNGNMGLRTIPCFAREIPDELSALPARRSTIAWVFSGEHDYGPDGFFYEAARSRSGDDLQG
jgi:hypothetical protein